MTFYLGAPEPTWISMTERPLFVSHTRLRRIRSGFSFPVSYPGGSWVVDSGVYDLIIRHGRHLDTPEQYVRAVRGYDVPHRQPAVGRSPGLALLSPIRHLSAL